MKAVPHPQVNQQRKMENHSRREWKYKLGVFLACFFMMAAMPLTVGPQATSFQRSTESDGGLIRGLGSGSGIQSGRETFLPSVVFLQSVSLSGSKAGERVGPESGDGQEESSWEGGPFWGKPFRWPAYLAISYALFFLSAAATVLFWRKHRFARLAIGISLALSSMHGFYMVLIDDGDGDFLQSGEFAVKASLGAMVLFFLSRRKGSGRGVFLAYSSIWLLFLVSLGIPHPFSGDGWESFQDLWSFSIGVLLFLGLPRTSSIPIRNVTIRRGLLAAATSYLYLVLLFGWGFFFPFTPFLQWVNEAGMVVLICFFVAAPVLVFLARVLDRYLLYRQQPLPNGP